MTGEPRLSVVLATDAYATIRGVVRAFAAQTIADGIELIVAGPVDAPLDPPAEDVSTLHSVRVVRVEGPLSLARSRAAGLRVARGAAVTAGETHAFPEPGFAVAALAVLATGPSAVVPGFANANPDGVLSWAAFALDYGRWSRRLPGGPIAEAPAYNTVMTRKARDRLGPRIDDLFRRGFDATAALRSGGHEVRHVPAAVLRHANVARPAAWARQRFEIGCVEAADRRRTWGRARRLAYVLGAPLIPPLIIWRSRGGLRALVASDGAPRLTAVAMLAGATLRAAGEARGFALGASQGQIRRQRDFEVHRLRFVTGSSAPAPAIDGSPA